MKNRLLLSVLLLAIVGLLPTTKTYGQTSSTTERCSSEIQVDIKTTLQNFYNARVKMGKERLNQSAVDAYSAFYVKNNKNAIRVRAELLVIQKEVNGSFTVIKEEVTELTTCALESGGAIATLKVKRILSNNRQTNAVNRTAIFQLSKQGPNWKVKNVEESNIITR
jgi:hypothetical protein